MRIISQACMLLNTTYPTNLFEEVDLIKEAAKFI